MLTADRLRELLNYDPDTGVFTYRVTRAPRFRPGDMAGHVDVHGYRVIGLDLRIYKAHRLAGLYMTGEWPKHEVDHKNLDKADNRWVNLRPATHGQNRQNIGALKNNWTGCKGVYLRRGRDGP